MLPINKNITMKNDISKMNENKTHENKINAYNNNGGSLMTVKGEEKHYRLKTPGSDFDQ